MSGSLRQVTSAVVEPLWREALGARLRRLRQRRRLTLTQTAERAGISAQYLSEVERGRKDPSSEMISAIVGALQLDLALVLDLTARDVRNAISLAGAHPHLTAGGTAARTRLDGPVALARPVALAA